MRKKENNLRKALRFSSLAIVTIGVLLMIMQIVYDSEPGAIPLGLILMGAIVYGVVRFRMPSNES